MLPYYVIKIPLVNRLFSAMIKPFHFSQNILGASTDYFLPVAHFVNQFLQNNISSYMSLYMTRKEVVRKWALCGWNRIESWCRACACESSFQRQLMLVEGGWQRWSTYRYRYNAMRCIDITKENSITE